MAYEQKEMHGSLLRNNKDGGNPNWPDYRGDAMINGVKLKISAWVRTPKNGGNKYLSLSFQPDDTQQAAPKQRTQRQTQQTQVKSVDDLPF